MAGIIAGEVLPCPPPDELGPRLRALADAVLPGRAMADLCCDHALVAATLVAEGRVPRAIAGDVRAAPLAVARSTLARLGVADRVALRRGDGFAVLEPGEVASVVIAGVGSARLAALLEQGADADRLVGIERMVLHAEDGFPRVGALRACIDRLGFGFVGETLVHERERFHLVMVVEPGRGARVHDAVDRELGPLLRRGDDPNFVAWRVHERERIARALADMASARAPAQREAFAAFHAMLG
jgi:tRNA (adenine22-N1)-methyltransferase